MPCGHRTGEFSGRTAGVAQRPVGTEIESFSEGQEVRPREATHRGQELLEPCRLPVELIEQWAAVVLGLVLRAPRAQGFLQVAPVAERSLIVELEQAADVPFPAAHQAAGRPRACS